MAVGEFGRSPQARRQHLGQRATATTAATTGRTATPACVAGAGVKRGFVYGKSDKTGLAPRWRTRSTRRELLATIYHSVGINPATIVYNHLNQPRELVKAEAVSGILS